MAVDIEKIIDFRDSLSSISLLKVTQVFNKMKPSEILEIRGADPDIRQDLFKVLPQTAYEIVHIEDAADEDRNRLRIRKCG
ncbi:sulfurtransferase TusA family protein [Desulfopila inferna]|uniref:sulfurtransferase TusA family protein n=1 Tax=Desulfopila inferna TaxID=468528 RepID=UPI00196692D0|nr:sulfurtransferase TusA family protein [Desulfopila inferna]MBM9603995.1 sulfurtransferase TusA family protein [Desulfopila inferna]